MGITLRYPYEVRKQDEYFDVIEDEKVPKNMLELAMHMAVVLGSGCSVTLSPP
jgi:DNA end-binding protein Ku